VPLPLPLPPPPYPAPTPPRDGIVWKELVSVGFQPESLIQHALIVAHTVSGASLGTGAGAVFAPQTEFFVAGPLTIVNYGDAGALRGCADCGSFADLKQGGYTYRWRGLTFVNTPRRVKWTTPFKQIFWDLDGTLTGHTNGWALPYYRFNDWAPACVRRDPAVTFDGGHVCDGTVVVRRLSIDDVDPAPLDFKVRGACAARLRVANAAAPLRANEPTRTRSPTQQRPVLCLSSAACATPGRV
jgi:hypothetical protein